MSTALLQQKPQVRPFPPLVLPRLDAAGWLVVVGLLLRLGHFLRNPTIWYDESALLVNILSKTYAQLLGPLDMEVAAPPLYLWSLRSLYLLFGDHPLVWRLPSLIIGCLTLLLIASIARRVLSPRPALLLIGLVTFSDAFIFQGNTIKPYILDTFFAAGILAFYLSTSHWPLARRLLTLAAAAPVLLGFSYPMLFVYAGVLLAFLPQTWNDGRRGTWLAYLTLVGVLVTVFALLHFGPMRAQRVPGLVAGWMNKFPNFSRPATIPGWVLGNTFLVFHYCFNPIGAVGTIFTGLGAWWCVRNRRVDWVCLCLGPLACCLLAAFLHAYPYSNNRLILFLAPGLGLMTAVGFGVILEAAGKRSRGVMTALVVIMLAPEVGLCAWRVYKPWVHPDAAGVTRFVNEHRQPGDILASDEGNYNYFFFNQVRHIEEVSSEPMPVGQRVWVLVDHYNLDVARADSETYLSDNFWELREIHPFRKAWAFLYVRTD